MFIASLQGKGGKRMKRILCDVDGTLNAMQEHFLAYVQELGYKYDFSSCNKYNMREGILHKDKKRIMNDIFSDDNFWLTLPVLPFAQKGLEYLNDNYEVFIVTVPWGGKHNEDIKTEWLLKEFSFLSEKQIVFSDNKWELFGDIIIEDKPETLHNCKEKGFMTIKKLQPYNVEVPADKVLHSWSEIERIL